MAQLLGNGQIKLNNGQTITPQNGGWYDAQQLFNGKLGTPGQDLMHGGGQVSDAVIAQTNPANVDYVHQQAAAYNQNNPAGSGGTPGSSGGDGGGGSPLSLPTAPTFDLVAATNAAYNTPEIAAAQKAITDRQTALASASSEINDNPFYSEATRVGKQAKLTTEANNDIGVQQDLLTSLKADAAIKVAAQQGQYNINEEQYKTALDNFSNLVSMGGLDNASSADIANLAVQTGIPTSVIQSIATASAKKNNPVSIQTSTDNDGNLTILGVDSKGNIVNQTTISGAGKAKTGSGSTSGVANVSPADSKSAEQNVKISANNGASLRWITTTYKDYLTYADILKIYNANSSNGKATESVADIAAGKFND